MNLFKTIVLPVLGYGCVLWNPHDLSTISKIDRIQGMQNLDYRERLKKLYKYIR